MKKLAMIFLILMLVSSVSKAGLGSGLMGYWTMDEAGGSRVEDVSVYSNHGEFITDETQPVWSSGISGSCVNLDGVNDRVVIENQDFFNFYDSLTIAVWVKGPMINNWQAFISKGGEASGWQLRRHEMSSNAGFTIRGLTPVEDIQGGTAIDDNQWHLILATFDNNIRRLYVDGDLDIETIDNGTPNPSEEPLVFGAANFGGLALGNFHSGLLDEIAIWDRALTAEEVTEVYNNGVAADLIYWRWNTSVVAPADNQQEVPFAAPVQLQWSAGNGAPAPVTDQVLFFGTDKLDVASSGYDTVSGDTTAVLLDSEDVSYDINVISDQTYYWRVASVLDGQVNDPNFIAQGTIWSFVTAQTVPSVISGPEYVFADAGDDISFMIDDFYAETYQWHMIEDANDVVLANDAKFTGVNTPELTINSVNISDSDDNGKSYYCVIANQAGEDQSPTASLRIKRMLANWPLDGDTTEATYESLTGIVTGEITWVEAPFGQAAAFDTGEYITIPASDDVSFDIYNAVTVSCMVRNPGSSGWESFVSKNGENGQGWLLRQQDGSGTATFTLRGTSGDDDPVGATKVDDGSWHNVVGVFDSHAGKRYVYVDGKLDSNIDDSGMIAATAEPVIIGRTPASWANYFNGEMAQVRIYNYPLASLEVAELYYSIMNQPFCLENPAVDLNNDCMVDISDFAAIAESWLVCNIYPGCN